MGSDSILTAEAESVDGVARVALSGELDIGTVPVLEDHLAQFENDGVSQIVLNLRDLTFMDSQGLRALLQARDRAATNGHRFSLVGAAPQTRRLLELTRTEFLLAG